MKNLYSYAIWIAIAVLGAGAFGMLALSRGETISAGWLVVAGVWTGIGLVSGLPLGALTCCHSGWWPSVTRWGPCHDETL